MLSRRDQLWQKKKMGKKNMSAFDVVMVDYLYGARWIGSESCSTKLITLTKLVMLDCRYSLWIRVIMSKVVPLEGNIYSVLYEAFDEG